MGRQADIDAIPELSDLESGPEELGPYASIQLDPEPAAAAEARRLTRDRLALWGMDALIADAVNVASELVANAVNAVPPGTNGLAIIIALHAAAPGLRISVWDIGPGHPHLRQPEPDDTTGRGLLMIDALTGGKWGSWPTPESSGKVVWAAIACHGTLPPEPQYTPDRSHRGASGAERDLREQEKGNG
jgi:anti-sigma regulatory factor (Ser/Thr protein kinase)